ncbi:MAG: RNA polymerase sigma factor [Rhodocyclaceae bacterium]|nr:RNA polymerase sigma factor [Rhodocyclaceae bacterium]
MSDTKSAIAELYREHYGSVHRFLAKQVSCRELAADLVQELFLRLLSREVAMADVRHPRGFLFSSARNMAAEAQRSPRWRGTPRVDGDEDEPADTAPSPDLLAEDRQALGLLLEVVAGLPPRCRETFILHKFEGLSYPEIAARLGISVSAVEKHLMRALDACRAGIDRQGNVP